jgi:hypothetical protein
MKRLLMAALMTVVMVPVAQAVTMAEDLATTIKLRGYDCGGRQVSNISEQQDAQGNKIVRATCPNGIRYQITVTPEGRMRVQPLN